MYLSIPAEYFKLRREISIWTKITGEYFFLKKKKNETKYET